MRKLTVSILALTLAIVSLSGAKAAVIAGPTLDQSDSGYSVSGLSFNALQNSILQSFIFQNQGQADTIVLANSAGTILQSVGTPAGVPSALVNVNWSLTAGNEYFLLQTSNSNSQYGNFGDPLPSDADIAITQSWLFDLTSVAGAVTKTCCTPDNFYWAAFNDITTSDSATPLPAALPLFATGLGGLGLLGWRRKRKNAA